ncbi:ABC transporter permease subunit [bacterium]|nr:ABC transporter permease subunit [bacterium]
MLSLAQFFFKCFIRSRRMLWMGLLGMIPVFSVMILYILKLFGILEDFSIAGMFSKMAFSMYLHFLMPLMAVFIGTSVIIDEVESGTLPYLLVRPVPRWQIILAKTLASDVLLALILTVSLTMTYLLAGLDEGLAAVCSAGDLIAAVFVLILGSFAYVSLFSTIGGAIRKPVMTSLLFTFGWEKIVGSIPGSLRYTTLIYYLNSLFPFKEKTTTGNLFSLLRSTTASAAVWKAILVLVVLSGIFHFITVSLLSWKEYVHQEE